MYDTLGGGGAEYGLFMETIRIRRWCPHCFSQWSRRFASKLRLAMFVAGLTLSISLGIFATAAFRNASAYLSIPATDPALGVFVAGVVVGWLQPLVYVYLGIRVSTTWQLTSPSRLCKLCREPLRIRDARFCSHCGTDQRLSTEAIQARRPLAAGGKTYSTIAVLGDEPPEMCIVCKMAIGPREQVKWCPHCGRAAHRDELLEWLHVKGHCPACAEHINEKELQMVTYPRNEEHGRSRRGKVQRTAKAKS
jgi:hypothetical protein